MAKYLIKLWLILFLTPAWSAELYRLGYFDDGQKLPVLKSDVISEWLRVGLRSGGTRSSVQTRLKTVNAQSPDKELKSLDFLILRASLPAARAMAQRFKSLGGLFVISDEWTREELGVEGLAVFSVAFPMEKRISPLMTWLNISSEATKAPKRAAYISQADSDYDKIWFFELKKNTLAKKWNFQEILIAANDTKVDFKKHKATEKSLLLSRVNLELLKLLVQSELPSKIVSVVDPILESYNEETKKFFGLKSMIYYLTVFPKGLTDEARSFENEYKDLPASDALLRDAVVMAGTAMARSPVRINTRSNFYASLDGLQLKGVTGQMKIDRGQLWREIFVVGQRGDDRVLEWRSGYTK
jgi:hypothetical protein